MNPSVASALARLARGELPADEPGLDDWDAWLRVGRAANLLGSLAATYDRAQRLSSVPAQPRMHLEGALRLARRQAVAVRWEAERIAEALAGLLERVILLKGAAYLADGLEFAAGRMFSDVDILVPLPRVAAVEDALMRFGWATTHLSAYDQTYYRRWMHEIPPMRHLGRGTVIDVHHRILPRTARFDPDPARMLAAARPSRRWPGIWVLSRKDMLLHSATHLYHEGETDNAFRDLLDIDALLSGFAADAAFPSALVARAKELQLIVPLGVVLAMAEAVVGTRIPSQLKRELASHAPSGVLSWMLTRGWQPNHALCAARHSALARWLIYARAHALRMPPHLLAYHLGRKSLRRVFDVDETPAQERGR
jgi:hypothetical protein